jgi:hypothetical protein
MYQLEDLQSIRHLKGTVSQDFLLQVFFHESYSSKPLKITLELFQIFVENSQDICKSRCPTGINNTGGKFATGTAGVVDIGGK